MTEDSHGSDDPTFDTARAPLESRGIGYVGLGILCHPDLARIGQRARLLDPGASGKLTLSRSKPLFRDATGRRPRALLSQRVSRLPIQLERHSDGSLSIRCERSLELTVEGQCVEGGSEYSAEQLDAGILLQLGKYVLLRLAHFRDCGAEPDEQPELSGTSFGMRQLRAELARVSELEFPLLLRGEPGAGKQLAAATLHRSGPRRDGPYISLDLAELTPLAAAAQLFGEDPGTSGPIEAHAGQFAAADGGTLFLHRIDAATPELQALLLRALQSGVLQPRNAERRALSVRLITASDADLEHLGACGRFSTALLSRLGYVIRLPALRERADDVPQLFAHFLQERLLELGEPERLSATECDRKPLLTAQLVTQLMRHYWPGNVRQLRDVARQFAVQPCNRPQPSPRDPLQTFTRRPASRTLGEPDIVEALARCAYQIDRTARELCVSRSWLHARIESLPAVRKAKDLSLPEIRAALEETGGELSAAALALKVSPKGLQLQMKRLGLDAGLDVPPGC